MVKVLLAMLGLLVLSACGANIPTQLLTEPCGTIANGNIITDVDSETEMCLVVSTDLLFQTWLWSADGSTLAFALHDPSIIRPPGLGKFPNRPLTIYWYVVDRNGRNASRFTVANNKGFSLSPDGKYAVVSYLCSADITGCHDIYTIRNEKKICSYKTYTVWFGDSDCPELKMKNGEIWDIEDEVNEAGCAFYRQNKWDIPRCSKTEPPDIPTSTTTPIIIEGYPIEGYQGYPVVTVTPQAVEAYPPAAEAYP